MKDGEFTARKVEKDADREEKLEHRNLTQGNFGRG
jgi:hypothetical protein